MDSAHLISKFTPKFFTDEGAFYIRIFDVAGSGINLNLKTGYIQVSIDYVRTEFLLLLTTYKVLYTSSSKKTSFFAFQESKLRLPYLFTVNINLMIKWSGSIFVK